MFRFTIRELILLTLIVAISVGWWIDNRRNRAVQQKQQESRVQAVKEAMRQAQQAQLLMKRAQNPPKQPFIAGEWTVEELREAVEK